MQMSLKLDHHELELDTGGGLYFKTTDREVFVTQDAEAPWWPHHESCGDGAGVWQGFGWRVAYDVPEAPYRSMGRR